MWSSFWTNIDIQSTYTGTQNFLLLVVDITRVEMFNIIFWNIKNAKHSKNYVSLNKKTLCRITFDIFYELSLVIVFALLLFNPLTPTVAIWVQL